VCVFDTGVNRAHALIEPALATNDLHTLNADWGVDDQHEDGHGTAMAGMILHGDLTAALGDTSERRLAHRLESVKCELSPPNGFDPNDPASYGALTQAAIALPEIAAPARPRVYCMAVTNLDVSGSTPSSWSAAIDQAAAGTMIGDDENAPKRLIVIAAGNIAAEVDATKIQPQDNYPIEDPAQAWNALTVGGYTDLIDVRDKGYEDWTSMAAAGNLSPHSRTSTTWPQGRTPFKPEVMMEAGNRALNKARTEALTFGSLSLLSTGSDVTHAPLVPFQATSAASAQGARLAARLARRSSGLLAGDNPRPDHPQRRVDGADAQGVRWIAGQEAELRACSAVRLRRAGLRPGNRIGQQPSRPVRPGGIQPFKLDGQRKFNECHYYTLPIPADMLEKLENEIVELKITLSYFIEPNPGLRRMSSRSGINLMACVLI